MDKKNKGNGYVSIYEIGGTRYKVETSFSGIETLNNKIIRLMLSEKIKSKGADNSDRLYGKFQNIYKIIQAEKTS